MGRPARGSMKPAQPWLYCSGCRVFSRLGCRRRRSTLRAPGAIGYYDTTPLMGTLERLIDFDLLNSGPVRLSVGAVNVQTGNFTYFDSAHQRLDVRHIAASGALPPGFAPVEIDGEHYWDGGLVSNTPLQYVIDTGFDEDILIFQVDLFSA